jgi:hypothetical protein
VCGKKTMGNKTSDGESFLFPSEVVSRASLAYNRQAAFTAEEYTVRRYFGLCGLIH